MNDRGGRRGERLAAGASNGRLVACPGERSSGERQRQYLERMERKGGNPGASVRRISLNWSYG